ncbi:MAG: hypothetical protein IT304_01810 [Dehalococcoidia bacterium]|nr:hypothetical protein [Dehalococcoidia bacterium]
MAPTPYYHGIVVSDLDAFRSAIAAIGFAPVAGEHGAARGQAGAVAPWLERGTRSLCVANAATGQQLHLTELPLALLVPRPAVGAVQGDTTIGVPAAGDPREVCARVRVAAGRLEVGEPEDVLREDGVGFVLDGQRFVVTRRREPFTVVHYSLRDWPLARRFYEEVLGYCFFPLPDRAGGERNRVENAGGRVDLSASPGTVVPPPGAGKRYAGANCFRLLNAKLAGAEERLASTGLGHWLVPPAGGFAVAAGPANEVVELYAASG